MEELDDRERGLWEESLKEVSKGRNGREKCDKVTCDGRVKGKTKQV